MIIENRIVVIDVETGGFSPETHATAEVAFIIMNMDLSEAARYEAIIRPYGGLSYTKEALAVNGLTMEEINNGKNVESVVDEMILLLEKHKAKGRSGKPIFVGHNIGFDMGFLNMMFSFCNKDLSKYIEPQQIDTLWLSRFAFGLDDTMENHKLETVVAKTGTEVRDSHMAMTDVEATADILRFFINKLRGSGSESVGEFRRKHSFKF